MRKTPINEETAPIVKLALRYKYKQHIIAGYFGDNQGRVSEIKNGRTHISAPIAEVLPTDFPTIG